MHESKAEPIQRLVKLVAAVHHGRRPFASTAAGAHALVRQFAEKFHERLGQFEFELRNELTRLAAEPPASEPIEISARHGFEWMLESYREALLTNVTAHTRAMITRQFEEVLNAYEEFSSIQRAA